MRWRAAKPDKLKVTIVPACRWSLIRQAVSRREKGARGGEAKRLLVVEDGVVFLDSPADYAGELDL